MKKLIGALLLATLVACNRQPGNTTMPSLANHRFTPQTITVERGETIRWFNDTDESHTVTAEDDAPEYFASGDFGSEQEAKDDLKDALIDPEEAYEFTFDEPGTYRYYCIPHRSDGMTGVVIVK